MNRDNLNAENKFIFSAEDSEDAKSVCNFANKSSLELPVNAFSNFEKDATNAETPTKVARYEDGTEIVDELRAVSSQAAYTLAQGQEPNISCSIGIQDGHGGKELHLILGGVPMIDHTSVRFFLRKRTVTTKSAGHELVQDPNLSSCWMANCGLYVLKLKLESTEEDENELFSAPVSTIL
ncbi:hypothetical protein CYMTET_41120 [Cymbomonas tetramitiformis]|uniref:Uncharacterized protein n=1 Tax=Cymbomonas tetramitiformis TaxID=36881 RepID=A0AAE0C6P2_9CHLO|nr:hypothetical protein CYMTET_43289 [Cymbomonas tetramitiformis]KAK3249446.1 hypothetical protein CYMTET_41120 [Cymbomonas tetramitiformis]